MKILFLIPLTAPNWINGAEALTRIYLYFHHAFRDFFFLTSVVFPLELSRVSALTF